MPWPGGGIHHSAFIFHHSEGRSPCRSWGVTASGQATQLAVETKLLCPEIFPNVEFESSHDQAYGRVESYFKGLCDGDHGASNTDVNQAAEHGVRVNCSRPDSGFDMKKILRIIVILGVLAGGFTTWRMKR